MTPLLADPTPPEVTRVDTVDTAAGTDDCPPTQGTDSHTAAGCSGTGSNPTDLTDPTGTDVVAVEAGPGSASSEDPSAPARMMASALVLSVVVWVLLVRLVLIAASAW